MAQFVLAMMWGSPLLNSDSISELSKPVIDINSNLKMALGFEWRNGMLSHGGHNRGWISWIDILPSEQRGLIILTNSESGIRLIDSVRCSWNTLFGIGTLTRYCEEQSKTEQNISWILKLVSLILLVLAGLFAWKLGLVFNWRLIEFTYSPSRTIAGAICLLAISGMWFVLLTDFGVYLFAGIKWGFPTIEYLPSEVWLLTSSLTLLCLVGGMAALLKRKTP